MERQQRLLPMLEFHRMHPTPVFPSRNSARKNARSELVGEQNEL